MYLRYFGLQEAPFSIAPNPRYLFMSDRHREALAHLLYGVSQGGGFVLLTGEVGTGKTTISRCLLEQLPENTDVAFILNPFLNSLELLATLCDELDIPYIDDERSLKDLTDQLHHFLLRNHAKGRNTVLLIDEAQHLQFEVLEQIRLLTNLETNTKKLLQIIFIGQPELQTLLAKPALRQLSQRITARFHIEPLTLAETGAYIRHRLSVAGLPANQELFPAIIIRQLHAASGGIPRLINILCDRMLLGSYAQNKARVDLPTFRQAVKEVTGKEVGLRKLPWAWVAGAAAALVVAVALGVLLQSWRQGSTASAVATTAVVPTLAPTSPAPPTTDTEASVAPVIAEGAIGREPPTPLAAPTAAPAEPWFDNRERAINALLQTLAITDIYSSTPCEDIEQIGLRCERLTVKNWIELRDYNRPAVLVLPGKGGARYAALLGMGDKTAKLATPDGIDMVPLDALQARWQGDIVFLWRPPPDYQRPLALGDRHAAVAWVALRFAELDQQTEVLAGDRFNEALAERVKLFQRELRLREDGVIGVQTLLRINDRLGLDRTLDNAFQDDAIKQTTAQTAEAG